MNFLGQRFNNPLLPPPRYLYWYNYINIPVTEFYLSVARLSKQHKQREKSVPKISNFVSQASMIKAVLRTLSAIKVID